MNDRKLLTKKDAFIIAALLVLAACALIFLRFVPKNGRSALITVDGKLYSSVSLAEDREFTLDNGVKITVRDGGIGFAGSDCHDKVCVRSGMISRSGETAACVPNKTVITVVGSDVSVDTITY